MTKSEELVYNYIKKNKPQKQVDIALGTELSPSAVYNALRVLEANGRIDYHKPRYEVRK